MIINIICIGIVVWVICAYYKKALKYKSLDFLYSENINIHRRSQDRFIKYRIDVTRDMLKDKEVIKFISNQNTILHFRLNDLGDGAISYSDIIKEYKNGEVLLAYENFIEQLRKTQK